MVGLLLARGKELTERAQERLEILDADFGSSDGSDAESESVEMRRKRIEERSSRAEMLRRVRVKAREGARGEEYEIKAGNLEFRDAVSAPGTSNGDVWMSDIGPILSSDIRQELSLQLRDLVDLGVAELEAYDNHAAESTNMYKQALKRREERRGSTSTSNSQSEIATSVVGILRNGHEQTPVDMNAMRRMSTGMPVVGAPVPPVRTTKNMKDNARRNSTSK